MRLRDVARVALGAESYGHDVHLNGDPIAGFAILLAPDANALEVAAAVRAKMDELDAYFPHGVSWLVPYDSTQFISISINEVLFTLIEAVFLVFLVILLFLQNLRATLIPTLVVPVALTSAFAGMYIAGFSINVLTLFGLVLAIGLVVDDAIVVVENVERIMTEEGLSPKEATRKAMGQITGAVIAMTTVLAAVFIPMALVGGSVGVIYRQFSLTIAISMAISALMALSFTPALCATLLKPVHGEPNRFLTRLQPPLRRADARLSARVRQSIRRTPRWMAAFAVLVGVAILLFTRLPTSFLPEEDQGYALVIVQLPPGASMERTGEVLRQMEVIMSARTRRWKRCSTWRASASSARARTSVSASSASIPGTSAARRMNRSTPSSSGPTARCRRSRTHACSSSTCPPIRGLGRFGGFDFRLEDRAGWGTSSCSPRAIPCWRRLRNISRRSMAYDPTSWRKRPNFTSRWIACRRSPWGCRCRTSTTPSA